MKITTITINPPKDELLENMPQNLHAAVRVMTSSFEGAVTTHEIYAIYKRLAKMAGEDKVLLTALTLTCNWLGFDYYEEVPSLGNLYFSFFQEINAFTLKTLKGNDLSYFLKYTD